MDIVFLTSEAVPFAKTGGLGDVCGALPSVLAERGHRVHIVMPAFRGIHASGLSIVATDMTVMVFMVDRLVSARLLKAQLPGSSVTVYFIDQPQYFDRNGLYGDANGDHRDNCERFAFFCRAALQAIGRIAPQVDIVHCNDWQTGLVPAYMHYGFESHPWMNHAKSVMTIHNLAYQGRFWHHDMPLTGLGWDKFNSDGVEFYGSLCFLKAGVQLADMITTVSPTYAEEIQHTLHGCGLDPVLRARRSRLRGIINGIDDAVWNPSSDSHLVKTYDRDSWREGKAANKYVLQSTFGLVTDPHVPLVGLVGRLADQKGWDLILQVMQWNLEENRPVQWMVLGTGDARYHAALSEFASRYPDRFGLKLGFSDQLAHQIEAGADIFLMPSRYEPCGLNQLYSLRYGTVPVVTTTGGLADTVVDATEGAILDGTATGFHIAPFTDAAIDHALGRAFSLRHNSPEIWAAMVERGMSADWSWRKSSALYEQVYAEALSLTNSPLF